MRFRNPAIFGCAATALLLTGCLGGDSHDHEHTDSTPVLSGVVAAPGGSLAFTKPGWQERLLAFIAGDGAHAVAPGTEALANATVELVYVDANGADGNVVATTTTDASGNYTFTVDDGAKLGVDYRLRVAGSSEILYARAVQGEIDIDPVSHAADAMIADHTRAAGALSVIKLNEAAIIQGEVENVARGLDNSDLNQTSVADMRAAIATAVANDEQAASVVANVAQAQGICGTVTDANSQPVANIIVVARDFGEWVTRGYDFTDSNGAYCIDIAAGDYILGALNRTTTSTAASGWYTATGMTPFQIDAEKVTVVADTSLTRNMQLAAGVRISGKVTAASATGSFAAGDALPGVFVTLRDFATYFPAASGKVRRNGAYVVNVVPGDYTVIARNKTRAPYGSGIYDGQSPTAGVDGRNIASKVSLPTAGDSTVIDFALEPGFVIRGRITDGGAAVTGERVRINGANGPVARLRTNKDGKYRFWVQNLATKKVYKIDSRGSGVMTISQPTSGVVVTQDFSHDVGAISGRIVDGSSNPVSQAKIFLYCAVDTGTLCNSVGKFVDNAVSNSDGTFTAAVPESVDYYLEVRIDDGRQYGSIIYNGKTQLRSGDPVTVTVGGSPVDLGDIPLPAGGLLQGTVTTAGEATPGGSVLIYHSSADDAGYFTKVSVLGDGSYRISLPANTYTEVSYSGGGTAAFGGSAVITAGATTDKDFAL